jgi:hypothetical protein
LFFHHRFQPNLTISYSHAQNGNNLTLIADILFQGRKRRVAGGAGQTIGAFAQVVASDARERVDIANKLFLRS